MAIAFVFAPWLFLALPARGDAVLENGGIKATFDRRGLEAIYDKATHETIHFQGDGFSVLLNDQTLDSKYLEPTQFTADHQVTEAFESGPWQVKVVYTLKPGWSFVSKQIFIRSTERKPFSVRRIEVMRSRLADSVISEQKLHSEVFLRLAKSARAAESTGLFVLLQNPYLQWKWRAGRFSLAYMPRMDWNSIWGSFASDRVCLGTYALSGMTYPIAMVPEWRYVPGAKLPSGPRIDAAEVNAVVNCVRAFILHEPRHTTRVHVGWCENDYQIDVATPAGREEYKRIIRQAAALGCRDVLFAPANSNLSSVAQNRDAWGWENVLWLGLGQKIRKGQWDPATDPIPPSLQEMLTAARSSSIKFLAYVYPSLPFMQNPKWTAWIKGKPGGYQDVDTGIRSFQDWLLGKLLAFVHKTKVGGFSFDHWWIAYDGASSKYAQWYGCRRILETLRERVPDIVIDGRQQYQYFGVWTWLGGSYPHPLSTDEQPQSFRAFPDLHLDRVSADRQRYKAWWYRMDQFCPPELLPGFITHQTPRIDAKGVMRRDRFRPRDWDYLGWRYSLISSIATAPFNDVVNMIPARDPDEFRDFSESDKQWFRGWLDWSDRRLDVLKQIHPILGQPMMGRVDGTAAFLGDHGYIFLFNPNYRSLPAHFSLDASIGLKHGRRFLLRQLYPDLGKGRLLGQPTDLIWHYGDHVNIDLEGTSALVLEVAPLSRPPARPILFNATGHVARNNGRLILRHVRGPVGEKERIALLLSRRSPIQSVQVNGRDTPFTQSGDRVFINLKFAGRALQHSQQIGEYDPQFTGGDYAARISIPRRIFRQLARRKQVWPIPYTPDDLRATWLGPDRLLLFVDVADPSNNMEASLKIDGQPVELKKAYTSIYPNTVERTFVGWYADISHLEPDTAHSFKVHLPDLKPGQFQGLFLDNVNDEFTGQLAARPN